MSSEYSMISSSNNGNNKANEEETKKLWSPSDSPNLMKSIKEEEEEENEQVSDVDVDADVQDSLDPADGLAFLDNEAKENKRPPLKKIPIKRNTKKIDDEEEGEEEETEPKKTTQRKNVGKRKTETKSETKTETAKKRTKKSTANATPHISEELKKKIGHSKALPAKLEGKEISYLPTSAGFTEDSAPQKLDTIPEDSIVVIHRWRKITTKFGDSYVLHVDNQPGKAYWGNSRVTAILNGGMVDMKTQMLTISRLAGGAFVYGTLKRD